MKKSKKKPIKYNLGGITSASMGLLNSFNNPEPSIDYGTNDYFEAQKIQEGREKAGLNLASNVANTFVPGSGLILQGASALGNVIDKKDQYGVSKNNVNAAIGSVLNPIGNVGDGISEIKQGNVGKGILQMIPGVSGVIQNKDNLKEKNILKGDFMKDQTLNEQDAYNQSVKRSDSSYMANGGLTNSNVELEKKENVITPDNQFIQFDGKSHSNGGIKTSLPADTMVFSDKLKPLNSKLTFAKLNESNNTNKEDKKLEDINSSNLSKKTADLMKKAKTNNSLNLFAEQELLKMNSVKKSGNNYKFPDGGKVNPSAPYTGYLDNTFKSLTDNSMVFSQAKPFTSADWKNSGFTYVSGTAANHNMMYKDKNNNYYYYKAIDKSHPAYDPKTGPLYGTYQVPDPNIVNTTPLTPNKPAVKPTPVYNPYSVSLKRNATEADLLETKNKASKIGLTEANTDFNTSNFKFPNGGTIPGPWGWYGKPVVDDLTITGNNLMTSDGVSKDPDNDMFIQPSGNQLVNSNTRMAIDPNSTYTPEQNNINNVNINKSAYKFPQFKGNSETLYNIGQGLAQNMGELSYLANEGKSYDTQTYHRYNPSYMSNKEELRAINNEGNSAVQNLTSASGGNAGNYMANLVALKAKLAQAKASSIEKNKNINTQIENQAKTINLQNRYSVDDINAKNKGQALSNYYQTLERMGTNNASLIRDNRAYTMDKYKMGLLEQMYPALKYNPELLKYINTIK